MPSLASRVRTALLSPDSEGRGSRVEGITAVWGRPCRATRVAVRFTPFRPSLDTGHSLLGVHDGVDLDGRPAREARDADRGTRRIGRGEAGRHDLVHAREVAEIGEIDGKLDDIAK